MADEAEIQAKIAALRGTINQAKEQTSSSYYQPYPQDNSPHHDHQYPNYAPPYRGGGRGRGWSPHARRGRGHYPPSFQNRSLVVSHASHALNDAIEPIESSGKSTPRPAPDNAASGEAFVSKRGRSLQLVKASKLEQMSKQRQQEIEENRTQQKKQQNLEERVKVARAFGTNTGNPSASSGGNQTVGRTHEIVVGDLRFRIIKNGSKLLRILEDGLSALEATPRDAYISGVLYHRTKSGNLVRDGLVQKPMRYRSSFKATSGWKSELIKPYRAFRARTTKLCPRFSNTGSCKFGTSCKLSHNPNKTAICKEYLRTGDCPAGDNCDLSHDPTPQRVSACTHFIRGNCTNDDCRYPHVQVNQAGPVCRDFAILGFCEKGADCPNRHVSECPDFANTGRCGKNDKGTCLLPHIERASTLRKAAAAKATKSSDVESDLSSEEEDYQEIDSDDVDSDDLAADGEDDVVMSGIGGNSHELTQQQDYVSFT